jgi:CheY-like chemotaxis protein
LAGDELAVRRRRSARTILVVEDDARQRIALASTLVDAGYAVDTASSGSEAITKYLDRPFDAVAVDLLLPDMTGLELFAALRGEEGRTPSPPAIVVTVAPDANTIAGFAVHGMLRKPLDRGELASWLDRSGVRADRKILVVDDDPSALKLMEAALSQLGFTAITRTSGASALEAVAEHAPAAVVLDLVMPEMDGVEFLDRFRGLRGHARTPVLIWTSKDLTAADHERLRHSAQGVLAKHGASPLTVVAQLEALLAGGS